MARIPLVDSGDEGADQQARDVLERVCRNNGGYEPNVFRAIANHPEALSAVSDFANVVYFENSLTPVQRELAYLTASLTNDCHY